MPFDEENVSIESETNLMDMRYDFGVSSAVERLAVDFEDFIANLQIGLVRW